MALLLRRWFTFTIDLCRASSIYHLARSWRATGKHANRTPSLEVVSLPGCVSALDRRCEATGIYGHIVILFFIFLQVQLLIRQRPKAPADETIAGRLALIRSEGEMYTAKKNCPAIGTEYLRYYVYAHGAQVAYESFAQDAMASKLFDFVDMRGRKRKSLAFVASVVFVSFRIIAPPLQPSEDLISPSNDLGSQA